MKRSSSISGRALVAKPSSVRFKRSTVFGFALSIAFGIPMALMIAYSRTVESFVYPLLVFSQSVPKIAIAPLFVVWFGFGIIPKVIAFTWSPHGRRYLRVSAALYNEEAEYHYLAWALRHHRPPLTRPAAS
mgnify:CR=1 FL=1